MNEMVVNATLVDPTDAAALGTGIMLWQFPFEVKLVYFCAVPLEADAGATLDLLDDAVDTGLVALDVSDKDDPGQWESSHYGGSNDPIAFAKDSEISVDINSGAAGNAWQVTAIFVPGAA